MPEYEEYVARNPIKPGRGTAIGRMSLESRVKSGSHWTLRWRGQSRANPSLKPKFPASRENAGNFIDSGLRGVSMVAKTRRQISNLRVNSLRIGTGNFLRPCRELNQAIREISALIRETAMTAKRLTGSGTRR
jgi:hypothetical protein